MHEVLQFLKDNPTFYIATMEGDQPRVRPFGAVMAFEGKLYLGTHNMKPVYQQLQQNPKLEICVTDKDGKWLRVSAQAVVEPRRIAREAMLAEYPSLAAMYNVDDGKFEVFYLKDATASFCAFGAETRVIQF